MCTNVANCDKGDNADRNGVLILSLLSGLSRLQENGKSRLMNIYNYYVSRM